MKGWTADEIDRELASIDAGTIAYGRGESRDQSARNFLRSVAVRGLLNEAAALRKRLDEATESMTALAKLHPDSPVAYRLPDWLGAHPVQVIGEEAGSARITIDSPDSAGDCWLPKRWLVEVRPPSIDDPVEWPLKLTDTAGDSLILYGADHTGPIVSARVQRQDGSAEPGVILSADRLLKLAQGAWQKYRAATSTPAGTS